MATRVLKIVCLIPPHYDFLCATVVDGLKQLNCRLYCSERSNNSTEKEYAPFRDMPGRCNDCDFILLFSNTNYSNRKQFVTEYGMAHKTVYVDGSDHERLEDPEALDTFRVCFKRELLFSKSTIKPGITSKNASPLPFSAEQAYLGYNAEGTEKDISVSCTLVPNSLSPKRYKINDFVKNLKIPDAVIGSVSKGNYRTESGDRSKEEYFRILARSRISISYPGLGFDTGRFWEILACKALLFSPPVKIKMPHPFLEFKHFIPYETLSQLKSRLLYYLDHEEELKKIAGAGHKHLLKYHTSKERARYLLNIVHKRLPE